MGDGLVHGCFDIVLGYVSIKEAAISALQDFESAQWRDGVILV